MNLRAAAALVLACALTCGAASSQEQGPAPQPGLDSMTFYIVKGAPDSCGRGCDSWIQAEGTIEIDTPARFKAFLDRLGDRSLPIYFNSPGGNEARALTLGNMLHGRPIVARVGRTIVQECGFEAQDSKVCIELKSLGRELHGELRTDARCASACPYFFVGAPVHEVAPDASLAVHSPKVMPDPRRPNVRPTAAADEFGHKRIDKLAAVYLAKMGVDAELLALIKTVPFEDIHVLTRDEIARFGFDRRDSVETRWRFGSDGLNLHKAAVVRRPGETSFRLLHWWVTCVDADRFVLDFRRPVSASPDLSSVSIAGDDGRPIDFKPSPVTASGREQWVLWLPRSDLQSLMDRPQVELTETWPDASGRPVQQTIKLSNEGWAGGLATLLATCPPATGSAALHAMRPSEAAAK